MKYLIITFLLLLLSVPAFAWQIASDPSPQNATHWKVVLDNGTEYNGTTCDNAVCWPIDNLPVGVHSGDVYFGAPEWMLNCENSTKTSDMIWSDPRPFVLERRLDLSSPSNMDLEE